jgi:transposase
MLRHLLNEAASALMTRCRQPSKLRACGVAVARKRAVIMHRMWVSGSRFETGVGRAQLATA